MNRSATSERLQKLTLPAMPEALRQIQAEQAREEPDIDRITAAIASDPGLAAEVLKVVNSPAFGLANRISSIPTAVMMLGLGNVINVVNGVALRATMSDNCKYSLGRFWDTAGDVALAAAALARELSGIPPDVVYTLGLMHDCGIPVLMCHLQDDYVDLLHSAQRTPGVNVTKAEQERFQLDHARVGWFVSQKWNMPEAVSTAIRFHHDFEGLSAAGDRVSDDVVTMVGLLKMAEHVSNSFRGLAFRDLDEDHEWNRVRPFVLAYFDIGETEFIDRRDALVNMLGSRD